MPTVEGESRYRRQPAPGQTASAGGGYHHTDYKQHSIPIIPFGVSQRDGALVPGALVHLGADTVCNLSPQAARVSEVRRISAHQYEGWRDRAELRFGR